MLTNLRAKAGIRSLLSDYNSNPKLAKCEKLGVAAAVLHLAPGNLSGHEVCPNRSPGCTAACLHFAGHPAHATRKAIARVARTKLLFSDRQLFMNILALEIHRHIKLAARRGMRPAVRLNGTSDIVWEMKHFDLYPEVAGLLGRSHVESWNIIQLFPEVQFYDYTAISNRPFKPASHPNYHLTFSLKEDNLPQALAALSRGQNVAAVFFDGLPASYLDHPVMDGDETDFRPADPVGVVVGLSAKGVAGRADQSGFVQGGSPLALAA